MIKDLKDKTFGYLKVLGDSGRRAQDGAVLWEVECVCGKKKYLKRNNLLRNKSCGCKKIELQRAAVFKGYKEIYATHWNDIKYAAKQRKLRFDITIEDAWELFIKQNRQCALTGEPLIFNSKCWIYDGTASLDRIDSTKGYVKGNVQWVHKRVNMMKQQYSTEEFFHWCKKIVEYNHLLDIEVSS